MASKHRAEELLKKGRYPSQIALEMRISVASVIQYLSTRVGEGALRLSDIYFSWPPEKRELMQRALGDGRKRSTLDASSGLTREEVTLFKALRDGGVFSGDMYNYLSQAEVRFHDLVRRVLIKNFGTHQNAWWRIGVPLSVREDCAIRRERDDDPRDDLFEYTTLIQLSQIISKNWKIFETLLPKEYRNVKKQFESDFNRLNTIRNYVMHPVKKHKWAQADFDFVRRMSMLSATME